MKNTTDIYLYIYIYKTFLDTLILVCGAASGKECMGRGHCSVCVGVWVCGCGCVCGYGFVSGYDS